MVASALSKFSAKTVLIVGDCLLDRYIIGSSQRISPEAPVPIVLEEKRFSRIGGACNAAANILALGGIPRLVGRVGDDIAGKELLSLLQTESIDTSGVVIQRGLVTPSKTRVVSQSQQLLRVDGEKNIPLSFECEKEILDRLPELFKGVSCVAISDYAKGTLSDGLLRAIIEYARSKKIPSVADPKGTDFSKYAGTTVLKPNALETIRASKQETVEEAAKEILEEIACSVLMVTRSDKGISLFYPGGKESHFPVQPKEVRDVTGAGDTVLALISTALASGIPIEEAAPLANVAAACAIERLGCAVISLQDIASHLLQHSPYGKVCTKERFNQLLPALKEDPLLFVHMPSYTSISSDHLLCLAQHVQDHPDRKVIACFDETVADSLFLDLIGSMQSLHLVVHGTKDLSLEALKDRLTIEL